MNLIVDAAKDKVFLKIITNEQSYTNEYSNTKENFDKMGLIIFDFLKKNNLKMEYIKNLFRGNTVEAMKSGRYTVKIYHAGRFYDIHLDSYFPIKSKIVTINPDENNCKLVDSDDSQGTKSKEITSLYFGRNTKGKGIWVPLLEKAYAKVYNSYGAITGGDIGEALRDLTGSPVFSWRLDHKDGKGMIESGVMWRKLCNAHEKKDVSIMKYFFGLVLIM